MKIAVLLIGESFRMGGQGTRSRDDPRSCEDQKAACFSHLKFRDFFSKKGVEIDFFIESYSTKYLDDIMLWYGEALKQCRTRGNLVGIERLSRDGVADLDDGYDGLLICRIDLFLKDMFLKTFDPNWEKVMFPFICWIKGSSHLTRGLPRVSDNMMFVPKRHLLKIRKKLFLSHDSWPNYLNQNVLTNDEMGVMVNTYHDSDSAKDYNPLYRIVNRPASKWWYGTGYEVGPDMKPRENPDKNKFPDWNCTEILGKFGMDKYPRDTWEWWAKHKSEPFFLMNGLMNFTKHEVYGQIIEHDNCDQSWWNLEDDKMVILDCNKKVSSVLSKVSEDVYAGPYEFNDSIDFMIKKVRV